MNKKKIITSALVGTIALAALSVSLTLAWYGASDRVNVDFLDVSMASEATLLISRSNQIDSFKGNSLVDDDFNEYGDNFLFAPVSSMHSNLWMDTKQASPVFYDCSSSQVPHTGYYEQPAATTYGVFSADVYLLSSLSFYVSLDVDECSFANNTELNEQRAVEIYNTYYKDSSHSNDEKNAKIEEIEKDLNDLIKCLRVSILVPSENHYNYYIINPNKIDENGNEEVVLYGGRLDNNGDGYWDTYETLVDGETIEKEVLYGDVENRNVMNDVYSKPLNQEEGYVEPSEEAGSGSHHKRIPQIEVNSFEGESKPNAWRFDEEAEQKAKDLGLKIKEEQSLSLQEIKDNENKIRIPCYASQPTRIVVSIYLEGWDRDCINATMGAAFSTKICFKLAGGIN